VLAALLNNHDSVNARSFWSCACRTPYVLGISGGAAVAARGAMLLGLRGMLFWLMGVLSLALFYPRRCACC
jgi:hypothetical protein